MIAFLQGLGGPEILLILLVLVLVFGATKVPQLARSLGRSSSEFKAGLREGGKDEEDRT